MRRSFVTVIAAAVLVGACGGVFEPATTTSTTTTTVAVYRPLFAEFTMLVAGLPELDELCRVNHSDNLESCYDGVKAQYASAQAFEAEVQASVQTLLRGNFTGSGGGGYNGNQYGCHDDGRCLDEYDNWCDDFEYDYVWFDELGIESAFPICPASYDIAYDDALEAVSDQQYEPDYHDDPGYYDDPDPGYYP